MQAAQRRALQRKHQREAEKEALGGVGAVIQEESEEVDNQPVDTKQEVWSLT